MNSATSDDGTRVPDMRRTATRTVFSNFWMTIREDEFVRTDNGATGVYTVVDKPDFAIVIAEENGCFQLVEQFRYPVGRRSWELPQGGWPAGKTGTALELAQAELAEETGFTAASWRHLGHLHEAIGFCSQGYDIFHATDLTPGPHAREDTEADMVHRAVPETEFRDMITGGRILDGCSITAYAMLLLQR